MTPPNATDFEIELRRQLGNAQRAGRAHIDIRAGDLHRALGDYPDPDNQRMPICNRVMRDEMKSGDQIIHEPPRGQGASLTIRYKLPR